MNCHERIKKTEGVTQRVGNNFSFVPTTLREERFLCVEQITTKFLHPPRTHEPRLFPQVLFLNVIEGSNHHYTRELLVLAALDVTVPTCSRCASAPELSTDRRRHVGAFFRRGLESLLLRLLRLVRCLHQKKYYFGIFPQCYRSDLDYPMRRG